MNNALVICYVSIHFLFGARKQARLEVYYLIDKNNNGRVCLSVSETLIAVVLQSFRPKQCLNVDTSNVFVLFYAFSCVSA